MLKFLKRYSIKIQLLIVGIVALVIMLLIVFITYIQTSGIIFDKNSEYTEELMEKMSQNISIDMDTVNKIVPVIAYNGSVQKYLVEDDKYRKFQYFSDMEKTIGSMKTLKDSIADILIIAKAGKGYNLPPDPKKAAEVEEFAKRIPRLTKAYYSELKKWDLPDRTIDCFLVGTHIYAKDVGEDYGAIIGELIIVLDAGIVNKQFSNIPQKVAGRFYLFDRLNLVCASNGMPESKEEADLVYEISKKSGNTISGKNYIVHERSIPDIGGKIVSVHYKNDLFKGLKDVRRLDLYILVTTIGLLFLLYFIIGRNVINPVKGLVGFINSIRDGNLKNLKSRVQLEGYEEISIVADAFNELLNSIDSLTHRVLNMSSKLYEAELAKKQAELEFLRGQVNPHFLYNTLETIKGMAVMKGHFEIRDMTRNLSNIFRYSIKGQDQVLLREEINTVKAYIQIQKIRFVGRFEDIYEFDDEVMDVKIIKMVMQPIVENAIIHGIEPKSAKRLLRVGGRMEDSGNVVLWVKDDGIGIDSNILSEMQRRLSSEDEEETILKSAKEHIGLFNVNWRLKLVYGSQYGLTINSELDKGTEVYIRIPGGDSHL